MDEATVPLSGRPGDLVRRGVGDTLLRVRDRAKKWQTAGYDHSDFGNRPGGYHRLTKAGFEMMIWAAVHLPRTCFVWFVGLQLIMFSMMAKGV